MNNSALAILDNDELLHLTRWNLDKGQFGEALISIKHLLERDDKPIESFRLGAKIYAQLGLFDHAKKAFDYFLEQQPDALVERFQYGMVHYDSGDLKSAIELWSQVLETEPSYPPALFYRALALANQGNPDEANKHLDTLIKSAPTDNIYFDRARKLLKSIEMNRTTPTIATDDDKHHSLDKYTDDDDRTIN